MNAKDSISNLKSSAHDLPVSVWNCSFLFANGKVTAQRVHTALGYVQPETPVMVLGSGLL